MGERRVSGCLEGVKVTSLLPGAGFMCCSVAHGMSITREHVSSTHCSQVCASTTTIMWHHSCLPNHNRKKNGGGGELYQQPYISKLFKSHCGKWHVACSLLWHVSVSASLAHARKYCWATNSSLQSRQRNQGLWKLWEPSSCVKSRTVNAMGSF